MNDGAKKIIIFLTPEINKKCDEIKQMRKEKMMSRLFVLLCMLVIIIPTMLVFMGINFIFIMLPAIMIAATFFILSSVLINQPGGFLYEQA